MTFESGVAVALGVVLKVPDIVFAARLVVAVEHRHMRRDLAPPEPCQELAGAVRTIRRDPVRTEIVPVGTAVQHRFGGGDFSAQARRRSLYIDDNPMIGVDQVIGFIAEAAGAILDRPGGLGIGFRDVFRRFRRGFIDKRR